MKRFLRRRMTVLALVIGLLLCLMPTVASARGIYHVYQMTGTVELRESADPDSNVVVTLRAGDYAVREGPQTTWVCDGNYCREEMWAEVYKATLSQGGSVELGEGGWVNSFDFLCRATYIGGYPSTPPEMPSRDPYRSPEVPDQPWGPRRQVPYYPRFW